MLFREAGTVSGESLRGSEPVVVVGAGLSGIATALGVALCGRRAVLLEAAELLGGASSYSGGQVWVGANHVAARAGVADDLVQTERYVRGIAGAHPELLDEQAMMRWVTTAPVAMEYWEGVGAVTWTVIDGLADYHTEAAGALASGRYLTGEPVPVSRLGRWRDRLRVSPYFRMGTTYDDIFATGRRSSTNEGRDEGATLTVGTGLVAGFLARAAQQEAIEIVTSAWVSELLRDEGRVVGVRADGPAGPLVRHGPVVLATSSFDWEPALVEELLGLDEESFGSMAPDSVRGDAINLARTAGGAVVKFPATCVPMVPGWRNPDGTFGNGPEYAMPHAMIVDRAGRRFCNDSYWVDLVPKALDQSDPHLPFFLIWDEQHHRKYGLGTTPPGGTYPDGLVTSAPTLRALGAALGIDGEQLEATAATFSEHARAARTRSSGEDPSSSSTAFPEILATSRAQCWGRSPTGRSTACGWFFLEQGSAAVAYASTVTDTCWTKRAPPSPGSMPSARALPPRRSAVDTTAAWHSVEASRWPIWSPPSSAALRTLRRRSSTLTDVDPGHRSGNQTNRPSASEWSRQWDDPTPHRTPAPGAYARATARDTRPPSPWQRTNATCKTGAEHGRARTAIPNDVAVFAVSAPERHHGACGDR